MREKLKRERTAMAFALNGTLRRSVAAAGLAATFLLGAGERAPAQYRLSPGDAVEIAIAGLPDQRHRVVIQADGTIVLPSVGSVSVAGLTPAELQAHMEAVLPTKVLRQRMPDGRENIAVVRPGDITATVAEYRPVYVTGDVLTPGQQAYRPMMTVRQVVAVAGGYSLLRSTAAQPGLDPVDLRRDYESYSIDYAKEYFRVLRIRAELNDEETFDQRPPRIALVSAPALAAVVQAEAETLKVALTDHRRERRYLDNAIKQSDELIVLLTQQEEDEEKGVKEDAHELDRAIKAYGSGNLPSPRVAEIRRALLFSATRRLQTSVELMRARRQREDYGRQLERIGSQRQINLLRELKEAHVRLTDLGIKLQALSVKLQPTGATAPEPVGRDSLRPEVTIVRRTGQQWNRKSAAEDAEVEPGDVIEVVFRPDVNGRASQ